MVFGVMNGTGTTLDDILAKVNGTQIGEREIMGVKRPLYEDGMTLPRKSTDTLVEPELSGIDSSWSPDAIRDWIGDKKLRKLAERVGDPTDDLEIRWDDYWAGEFARAEVGLKLISETLTAEATTESNGDSQIQAVEATYVDFLPGKYLMYKLLTDAIIKQLTPSGSHDIHPLHGTKVVEVGGGSGLGLTSLARAGALATNYDFSEVGLEFFTFLTRLYEVEERTRIQQGNFYDMGLPNESQDVAYNVGVFEHLTLPEQRQLMSEMTRITRPGGLILVSVPNLQGPHYGLMRGRQEAFHQLDESRSPMDYLTEVNVPQLMRKYGVEPFEPQGVLIAPSVPIDRAFVNKLNDEDRDLYSRLPQDKENAWRQMNAWELLEDVATPEQRMRLGWFQYTIGIKK